MKFFHMSRVLLMACVLVTVIPTQASVTNIYVGQTAAGSANGTSCANAFSILFMTTYSNWGAGSAQIGPGSTVHLCGMITTQFPVSASGTSGNPITIYWESGARLSVPYCVSTGGSNPSGCIDFQGNSYITLNGGTPCGPGTSCSATEAANPTGYPAGITGIIEATANGSALANQQNGTAIAASGATGIVIENLIIRNIYQFTESSDTNGGSTEAILTTGSGCTNCSFHDLTIHDAFIGVDNGGAQDTNVSLYSAFLWNTNWGFYRGTSEGNTQTNISVHDSHFGSVSNWDQVADNNHHDRIFMADGIAGQGNFNGLYIYNNLFDGTSGCCSTAMIYWGGGTEQNAYVFNNVFNDSQGVNSMNALLELTGGSGDTAWVYNNTLIGAGTSIEGNCVQLEGTVVFVNNAITSCAATVLAKSDITFSMIDYHSYANANSSYIWESAGGTIHYVSLPAWQAFTAGEAHSTYSASLLLSATGVPEMGSPAINAGTNLTPLCTGVLVALCSDTSAGGTRTPSTRPSAGSWTAGAFNYSVGSGPNPPTSLSALVQ